MFEDAITLRIAQGENGGKQRENEDLPEKEIG
jgi:hypothetical protein